METNVNSITVNGVEYVVKGSQEREITGDIKIVILQRGWIMIGKFQRIGNDCKLSNASIIRNWGTTKGLGELASEGATGTTKLDKCYGTVQFDYLTVVATIDCEESKWKKL